MKILVDRFVGYSYYRQTVPLKKGCSLCIILLIFFGSMLCSVKLNNDPCISRVKVNNIFSENFLPRKLNGIASKKIVPKMTFFLCHIPA